MFLTQPIFSLFDDVDNPKIWALIGIALGCDALPGGVHDLGASSLHNLICTCNLNDDDVHLQLATKLSVY